MARPRKSEEAEVKTPEVSQEEVKTENVEAQEEVKTENVKTQEEVKAEEAEVYEEASEPLIDKAMRLNPQYKKLYITRDGFVHPEGSPKYLIEGVKLYNNKYSNK